MVDFLPVMWNQDRIKKLKPGRSARGKAKRYKLPSEAVRAIRMASKLYGTQGRAIQVAVEILWRTPGCEALSIPKSVLESPIVGMTYKLPPRTVDLVEALAREYGETRGHVLAACIPILQETRSTEGKSQN